MNNSRGLSVDSGAEAKAMDGSHLTKDHAHATKDQNQVQLESRQFG